VSNYKAEIFFSVARILKKLKKMNPGKRVQQESAVFTAGVLEYLTAELLELSGNVAKDFHRKTITPRHIYLAAEKDQELKGLLRDVTIMQSGVVPNIHPVMMKQKISTIEHKRKRDAEEEEQGGKRTRAD
jgi:histone H2A